VRGTPAGQNRHRGKLLAILSFVLMYACRRPRICNWAPVAGSRSYFRLYQRAPYDKYPTDCPRDGLVKLAIMLHVRNNDGACAH
jgi:hypothetical protein